ncbi:hypothetical protein [Streptomyces sp. NPDC001274]
MWEGRHNENLARRTTARVPDRAHSFAYVALLAVVTLVMVI